MTIKDIFGLLFCGIGATIGTVGYRLLGLAWYFGASVFLMMGILLIWSAARDRRLRDSLDEVSGDWGDRHYTSGASATDGIDVDGD